MPLRPETALRQFSIAVSNNRGRQIRLPHWAKGLVTDQTVGPKVPEDPSTLQTDRLVDHLLVEAALLAQTAMGAAVHSGTVVGVAQRASPVEASLVAIRLEVSLGGIPSEVSPVGIPLEVSPLEAEAFMVAVAAIDNYWASIGHSENECNLMKKGISFDPLFFIFGRYEIQTRGIMYQNL